MIKVLLSLSLLIIILTGCSGTSSSSFEPTEPIDYDGTYNLSALSTTPLDINGDPCGDASGTIDVDDSKISGTIIDTWGITYDVNGDISSGGDVFGGFARAGSNVATFEGSFSGDTGSGTWVDVGQCEGEWEATKN